MGFPAVVGVCGGGFCSLDFTNNDLFLPFIR
jgi:hypothetical protein